MFDWVLSTSECFAIPGKCHECLSGASKNVMEVYAGP